MIEEYITFYYVLISFIYQFGLLTSFFGQYSSIFGPFLVFKIKREKEEEDEEEWNDNHDWTHGGV